MVAAAGQAAPFHHATKVHRSFCAADEPQVQLSQQIASTRNAPAAASRGPQQTACAGSTSSGSGYDSRASTSLRQHAASQLCTSRSPPASSHVSQQPHVRARTSSPWQRCPGLCPARLAIQSYGHPATTPAAGTRTLWQCATAKHVSPRRHANQQTTRLDHGTAAERYPCCHSARGQPPGPHPAHSLAAQPGLLSSTRRDDARRRQYAAHRTPRQSRSARTKQPRLYPQPRRKDSRRGLPRWSEPVALNQMLRNRMERCASFHSVAHGVFGYKAINTYRALKLHLPKMVQASNHATKIVRCSSDCKMR